MTFPAELDEYLDRSASLRDFDFGAISRDLVASASGLLRHPFADEPDDLVAARAQEVFSPESLRARWEERHGAWEVVSDRAWEVVSHADAAAAAADGGDADDADWADASAGAHVDVEVDLD